MTSGRLFGLLILFLLTPLKSEGQTSLLGRESCGFDEWVSEHPISLTTEALISQTARKKANFNKGLLFFDSIIIPIVIHVIHDGGAENITDSQIFSQIEVLNEDFRKKPGTPGDGMGVDTKIQFCIARKNPQGRCTNGIIRIRSSLTNHSQSQRGLLKKLSFWDPTRYLNIYIVKTINGGVLGYSSFPDGPSDADGVVIKHSAFGRTGTVKAPNHLGRTLTHEISHWFGLYHIFQDGCGEDLCTDGDKVCDTPPAAKPNSGCPQGINSCNNDIPDVPDQIENYTDYTSDVCKNMFTEGQRDRMLATLSIFRTTIWSEANVLATGCSATDTFKYCPIIADFTVLTPEVCSGTSVKFFNRSQNGSNKWQWHFLGGVPSESTAENPIVTYTIAGTYDVSLVVSNENSSDSIILTNYISVSELSPGDPEPYSEGFEQMAFPPSGMTIDNPDGGITWQRTTVAAKEGKASAVINNLVNTNYGQSDALILPALDLTGFQKPLLLSFKWAYARSDPSFSDELIVQLSTDCGNSFTDIFSKSGSALASAPLQDSPFIPLSNQWKSIALNLDSFSTNKRVIIQFVNVTDGGNNLYLDSIAVGNFVFETESEDEILLDKLDIFPSPSFVDHIVVRRSVSVLQPPKRVNIIGMSKADVRSVDFYQSNDDIIINTSGIPSGIYFLEIIYPFNALRKKILIQH